MDAFLLGHGVYQIPVKMFLYIFKVFFLSFPLNLMIITTSGGNKPLAIACTKVI